MPSIEQLVGFTIMYILPPVIFIYYFTRYGKKIKDNTTRILVLLTGFVFSFFASIPGFLIAYVILKGCVEEDC